MKLKKFSLLLATLGLFAATFVAMALFSKGGAIEVVAGFWLMGYSWYHYPLMKVRTKVTPDWKVLGVGLGGAWLFLMSSEWLHLAAPQSQVMSQVIFAAMLAFAMYYRAVLVIKKTNEKNA